MSLISKHSGDSYGSLSRLFWAYAQDLAQTIPAHAAQTLSLSREVIDRTFHEIQFESEKAAFVETQTTDRQGMYYQSKVTINLINDRPDIRHVCERIRERKVLLLIYDHQGLIRLVGTPEQALRLKSNYKSGKKVSHSNGYELEFTGSAYEKSLLVTITA